MKTMTLDNVERVEYLDVLTKGRLSNIQVILLRTRASTGAALLRDQFLPQTVAERIMVKRPVPTPIEFDIDPDTLTISALLDTLKSLEYKHFIGC